MAKTKHLTAEQMGKAQREISISEFFAKNRHLLGFDNKQKALLTTIKEAVDNSLDACEEAGILPDLVVEIHQLEQDDRFRVVVQDNGPGIVRAQIPNIFGKLLYGSKFHSRRQSRGQQGIGISAAGLYGQMTTGKGPHIISKTIRGKAHHFAIQMDSTKNKPLITKDDELAEWHLKQGTRFEIEIEASYKRGLRSVDDYIKQTAVSNPHASVTYLAPGMEEARLYERASDVVPERGEEIKPHPYGVELGELMKMLRNTNSRWLSGFLQEEFCRVGPKVAKTIIAAAGLTERSYPSRIAREEADSLYRAIQAAKISAPPTTCLSPIGEERILDGLQKETDADFYAIATRPPSVYRGNPFQIEVGIAWAKPGNDLLDVDTSGRITKKKKKKNTADTENLLGNADEAVRVLRFANRVPLLSQQSSCGFTKAVINTAWKNYGLSQSRGAMPVGSAVILIHMASVWVPFTSEAKEAIAPYNEILKEVKLALQEAGRKLGQHIRKGKRVAQEFEKRSYIESYLPHVGIGLQEILGITDVQREDVVETLRDSMETKRKI
ncbi:MAG: DNA topoisomerase VI subunit B [Planctomycetes bacterium]|nr:DNA topoisomerase VI subunit B [Planctomycetota bacterium]MBT4028038.1 DNA topoisomerase VI subunit B [Planctomycetota bacterium]MBT4561072.1 DNA topoisomerase VI subunit B [Planctomycetota bacterium]MBT5119735.1 DNA topoisomerase VI subunit B [Planctomycetota bacterium]MBT7318790.1 DNA topoisomerase VI subunit B [Planctomycetota bacterium]